MTSGHCLLCSVLLLLCMQPFKHREGTQYPGPGTRVPACTYAHTHTPQGGQVATPDGEPHGKETHRLAGSFSSSARGKGMTIQLAQEDYGKGAGEGYHERSPAQCRRDYVQRFQYSTSFLTALGLIWGLERQWEGSRTSGDLHTEPAQALDIKGCSQQAWWKGSIWI